MKVFESIDGLKLAIKHRKNAVIFELNGDSEEMNIKFRFDSIMFKSLYIHLLMISEHSWEKTLNIKEADSFSADYDEYYDRKLDNNGYLSIAKNKIHISRPSLDDSKLYQFNKRKMESFLYDYKKLVD